MSDCPCCSEPWVLGEQSAEGDTPWNGPSKFYLYVGTITTTIATSQAFTAAGQVRGQTYDGTDTYITDSVTSTSDNLKRYSGQFTSTVKASQSVYVSGSSGLHGISWAGASTYWLQNRSGTRYFGETSGNFTSTVRQSVALSTTEHRGMSHDAVDTFSVRRGGAFQFKWTRYSGQFTSTIQDSVSLSLTELTFDMTFEGSNTLCAVDVFPAGLGFIGVYQGAFTSTLLDSATFAGVASCVGLNSNNAITG